MAECNHDCSSCKSKCGEATSLLAPQNAGSQVKRVIGVVSGKGGVGKSLVTGLLATLLKRRGIQHGGAGCRHHRARPSPRCSASRTRPWAATRASSRWRARPACEVMSINLLLEHDTDPVVWRGALIMPVRSSSSGRM